ncbi:MAG: hypothetical protein K8T91_13795 [Planctomycetes bacterium]|nr:hypothetical protein [Planctomycetota bacterium]
MTRKTRPKSQLPGGMPRNVSIEGPLREFYPGRRPQGRQKSYDFSYKG